MKEAFGDIWDLAIDNKADAVVLTTNGFVKLNGEAVMGRGIALEAKTRYPTIPAELGKHLKRRGNHVCGWSKGYFDPDFAIVTLPVKKAWKDKADIHLIKSSIEELVSLSDIMLFTIVFMPRPGCGNGGLSWEKVKPIIEPMLDDRFWVCDKERNVN